jgi:phosphatidate cytidylyltransferase
MHLKRWLTSIVAAPLIAALIIFGPMASFGLLIAVVGAISAWEYFSMLSGGNRSRVLGPIPAWCAFSGLLILIAAAYSRVDLLFLICWVGFAGMAILSLKFFSEQNGRDILDQVAKGAQFLIYIPLPLAALTIIRAGDNGVAWIFFLVLIIFLGDAAAFYAGTYLGRHKLHPAVSPGKTIEGAIGGLAANILVALVFKVIFLPELPALLVLVFAVTAGVAGQLGDLFESELKRTSKIKDSGNILPGHGGILDRIDALLFAAPVAYVFNVYIF